MNILRTASLGPKFTGSYKDCIPMLPIQYSGAITAQGF